MNEKQQTNEQQLYLGQRCHVEGQGFGTIVNAQEVRVKGTGGTVTHVRVELDAGVSHWYELKQVELLNTYPAG